MPLALVLQTVCDQLNIIVVLLCFDVSSEIFVSNSHYSSTKPRESLISMNNQYGIWIMKPKVPKSDLPIPNIIIGVNSLPWNLVTKHFPQP